MSLSVLKNKELNKIKVQENNGLEHSPFILEVEKCAIFK